jgi:hypothetical protein
LISKHLAYSDPTAKTRDCVCRLAWRRDRYTDGNLLQRGRGVDHQGCIRQGLQGDLSYNTSVLISRLFRLVSLRRRHRSSHCSLKLNRQPVPSYSLAQGGELGRRLATAGRWRES